VNRSCNKGEILISSVEGSQALEADALHFRVDVLTSSIVLGGLAVVYIFGYPNADA
jgi:divalent metal cation (Fe/Co/Zn/Cd) transporter